MSLSAPEDVDDPADPDTVETDVGGSDGSENDGIGRGSDMPTVELFGEEMPLKDAMTIVSDVLKTPTNFGIVESSELEETEGRITELEDRVEQLEEGIDEMATFLTQQDSLDEVAFQET